jgi:hypothetical protein
MSNRTRQELDLERIQLLASKLADSDPGPAGELACALADAVMAVAGRVEELWQLIAAALQAAGLHGLGDAGAPPAEFVQALTSPHGGDQGVRLNISGKDWVAAISQDQPPADPAAAWAALERLARSADDQDPG